MLQGPNQFLRNALPVRAYQISKAVRATHTTSSAYRQTSTNRTDLPPFVMLSPTPSTIMSSVPTMAARFTTLKSLGVPAGNTYAGGRSLRKYINALRQWAVSDHIGSMSEMA